MPKVKKNTTVISDPLLDPFYITKDDMCYTVNERITPNGNHFRSKKGGKEYSKPQGYYTNFSMALEKIAYEKLHTRKEYKDIIEFLNDYKQIEKTIKQYTDGIRGII